MADMGTYDESAPPAESYDLLPPGEYIAQIEKSDVKPTKQKTGDVLSLNWRILEGDLAGRIIFDRVNIRNNNPDAQAIGVRQLASIRLATGVNSPRRSEELHNIPCVVKVKIRPAGNDKKGVYRDAQNEVKGYEKIGDVPAQPLAAPAPSVQRQPAQPVQPGKPPWKR